MSELERIIEDKLIEQLTKGKSQWTYRPDLTTEEALWDNIRKILENGNKDKLNDKPLTDKEFEQVKNQLSFATFYDAAKWISGENGVAHVSVQRDTETVQLTALKRDDIAGGSSVYEVINQYQALKDEDDDDIHSQNRRFDVSLLINGIPLIHIELKNREHTYMDGFRQIRKYIRSGKFRNVFSAVQMFVISNGVDTKYFAAAEADELNEKFLSGWTDEDNNPVNDYLAFAEQVLKIPQAHQLVMKYSVLDQEARKILLLRPYQIHAIEAVRSASKRGQSGFIWHTTGSGKTMTSYKEARNLLIDIPSIEKTIFLIDRKDLDTQTTQAFQSYANADVVDVDNTENVNDLIGKLRESKQQVVVTTIQKLQIMVKKRLREGTPAYNRIKNLRVAFIVDECHRAVTPATQRMLSEFFHNSLWYGFTGTPRFDVNAYPAEGDLPRTTDALFSNGVYLTDKYAELCREKNLPFCLHKYTVKEAIRDEAVLGFTTEHLGPENLDSKDSNENIEFYDTETHMLKVLDIILNRSGKKLGFDNGKGKTYEALLTVKSIKVAQAYYELLKKVKKGETEIEISEETKKVLPDFPKFAITYSVSSDSDDESADLNVPKMTESLNDYNEMFGTSYGIGEIKGYNANLNDRLARKKEKFKNRAEQLDLVIVVNRLLTGFDAPCLSTVFIDRQPMHPHDIIQTFSRTNRLFDDAKTSGQIVTFQSPHIFKKAVDDALVLYSAGGEASVLAPDWETSLDDFRKALAFLRLTAEMPEDVAQFVNIKTTALRYAKAFQEFDKTYTNLKAFTKYADHEPDFYGITKDEYDNYYGWYQIIKDKYKGEPKEPTDPPIDFEYQLKAYSREKIDYDYIVSLIQSVASADDEERNESHYRNLIKEITSYIDELMQTNPKLGELMKRLWDEVQENPDEFKDKRVSFVLKEMRDEAIVNVASDFADKWCVPKSAVMYAAQRMKRESEDIPGLNNIKESADYAAYKEKNGDLPKFKYNQAMKKNLRRMILEDIIPLRDDDYRIESAAAQLATRKTIEYVMDEPPLQRVAEGPAPYGKK